MSNPDIVAAKLAESETPIQLATLQRNTVREIVNACVPNAKVFVFGSRATWKARPYSDLDLLFVNPARLTLQQRADLAERFEASDLPFRVDLVEVDALERGVCSRVNDECIAL